MFSVPDNGAPSLEVLSAYVSEDYGIKNRQVFSMSEAFNNIGYLIKHNP
ncbi:hypothetical protein C900_04018 [Fulvivirga imtechensis AK7]|uniref:Uncharacterized protein n=1 Tax=Fulvivirga imtechensis AK7 TaxID=1237149 RepID=L8JQ65_9BACT|nr:hypothetical protein C900_04018 [Fulvivirga imtechensis AK7]